MGGSLNNPTKYSTLEKRCICCNAEQSASLDKILSVVYQGFKKLHSLKGDTLYDEDTMKQYVKDNFQIVFIDDKYLVLLDVIQHWMSPNKVLSEELVFKYGEGEATTKDIIECLEYFGNLWGCHKIIMGTAGAHGRDRHEALSRAYEQAGMELDFITLRRIIHGSS